MRRFRLDVTTLLAGLLAGILPACLFVVISYFYLTGLKPEVLSSLQEPHLERGKERVALLHRIVERRRNALVTEVQRALVGDADVDPDSQRSTDFESIEQIHWYLHDLDDASYTSDVHARPTGVTGSEPAESLLRQQEGGLTDEVATGLGNLALDVVDSMGFPYAYMSALKSGAVDEAFGRRLLLEAAQLPPEAMRQQLLLRNYEIAISELPKPVKAVSERSPRLPSTIEFDLDDSEDIWLSFRNGQDGGTLALRLEAAPFLERARTELEQRFPTPEGVVFRVKSSGTPTDPDRLWGRWPLQAPFDQRWELWAGPTGESAPLLVTVLQKLGAIHYLYGGLSLIALMTVVSFLLTAFLSRRVRDSRQKDDFLRMVSHELRTPIASIRMIAETLKLGRVRTESERHEFHEQLEKESRRLGGLIERVLEYGKGGGEREVVTDPVELVEAAVSRFREREKSHAVVDIRAAQEFHPVLLDREGIIGVIYNLLSNAAKYSPSDLPIEVTIGGESKHLFITVCDHGPGIRRSDVRKIFRPFYRGENSSHAGGFGLGLAYCREVARHHGGRMSVSTQRGSGSRFTLEIPLLSSGAGVNGGRRDGEDGEAARS